MGDQSESSGTHWTHVEYWQTTQFCTFTVVIHLNISEQCPKGASTSDWSSVSTQTPVQLNEPLGRCINHRLMEQWTPETPVKRIWTEFIFSQMEISIKSQGGLLSPQNVVTRFFNSSWKFASKTRLQWKLSFNLVCFIQCFSKPHGCMIRIGYGNTPSALSPNPPKSTKIKK